MSLCAPVDTNETWVDDRKTILQILSASDVVNTLISLLSVDFHAIEQDARKEQQLRAKFGGTSNQSDSILISQLQNGIAIEFERSDAARKLRLLLSEILFVMAQMREQRLMFQIKESDLLENEIYLEEVSDVLCIAQAELPSLLPMTELAETLLRVKEGSWLLCRLVANVPDSFMDVVTTLVCNGEKQDDDTVGTRIRTDTLLMLCEMNISQILKVRSLCVEHCRLPSLAVQLTLRHCELATETGSKELVSFVCGLLLGSDSNVRNWFSQFVRNGQKQKRDVNILQLLRDRLLEALCNLIPNSGNTICLDHVVQASAFIRLYCALKGIAGLRFSGEESSRLLELVTCHPPPTASGIRFITLGLCMLLGCPTLLGSHDEERSAVDWIRWLISEEENFERETGENASFGEMLFLIAIHFHSNQTQAIADLVCSTLGMKSAVKANALMRMKVIFTQEIFNDQVVTSHAVKVAITENLNANIPSFLPIHCIYQLLKSRAFSKHKVPIKDWIYKQICSTTRPLHPLLAPLIEVYINTILVPSSKTSHSNEPFTEEEIKDAFKGSFLIEHSDMEIDQNVSITGQLLLLYYLLLYEDTMLNNMKTIVSSNRKVQTYSQSLVALLPIKYLVQQAHKDQSSYVGLFSPLLKLLATHYPHLCLVEDWLDEDISKKEFSTGPCIQLRMSSCSKESFAEAFNNLVECPAKLMLQLKTLLGMPIADMVTYTDIITKNLPKLLEPQIPRKVQDLMEKVWMKLNTVMPRRLRVMTVNALRPKMPGDMKMSPYTQDDIMVDPLIVLRCDDRIFRCPPLLEITLRILAAYLQASRAYLTAHLQANPIIVDKTGQVTSAAEREELRKALVATQESAAVQLLLETCLVQSCDLEDGGASNLREIHCLICSHLHQMFIADPPLCKLVHFQGYPSELLPMTVKGIPSMHICLDFIPELLSQPDSYKQAFAIELTSHLSLQFALPKSLSIAKLCVNVMTTLLSVLTSECRPEFFTPVLPSLVRMSKAFPPLCDDIVAFLMQLGRICASHISATRNKLLSDSNVDLMVDIKNGNQASGLAKYHDLYNSVQETFGQIASSSVMVEGTS